MEGFGVPTLPTCQKPPVPVFLRDPPRPGIHPQEVRAGAICFRATEFTENRSFVTRIRAGSPLAFESTTANDPAPIPTRTSMNRFWLLPVFLPALAIGQDPEPPAAPTPPPAIQSGLVEVNRIAAKVNGKIITAKDLRVMLAPEISRLMAEFPRRGPEFERQAKELQDQILQELIDRQLIMSEFEKLKKQKGADLPDKVVDREIDRQIETLYNGNRQKFREELDKARMGMESYRKLTKEKLIVQAMRSEKFKDAPPPLPGEVRAEYEESKSKLRDTSKDVIDYRKIYLRRFDPANPLATPDTQLTLAESLAEQLRNGADFAELAEKHSQDAFADEGGLQTEVPRTDLSPEFAAILFDAEVGKIVGPLEDPAGFTIARVERIDPGPVPPLDDEVRELMENRVRAKKSSERYDEWIADIREKAMIDVRIK
mgnify:CR=1 FL=1